MAKRGKFGFEKRQRELRKKKKKEEKAARKSEAADTSEEPAEGTLDGRPIESSLPVGD